MDIYKTFWVSCTWVIGFSFLKREYLLFIQRGTSDFTKLEYYSNFPRDSVPGTEKGTMFSLPCGQCLNLIWTITSSSLHCSSSLVIPLQLSLAWWWHRTDTSGFQHLLSTVHAEHGPRQKEMGDSNPIQLLRLLQSFTRALGIQPCK